jgi:D-alanyl-D-alanine carboxypeptidase
MRRTPSPARGALAATLLLAMCATPCRGQRSSDAVRISRTIDSIALAAVKSGQVTGLAIGVTLPGHAPIIRYAGRSAQGAQARLTDASIFRVASITKQFTAAAIMQLVERGRVSLDADVRTLLPDWPADRPSVTVRQLLTHTSGVREVRFSDTQRPPNLSRARTRQDTIAAYIVADTSDFAPGTAFRYSNAGYFLLGRIVERVSGMPLATYWTRRVFARAGMRLTTVCAEAPTTTNVVLGDERTENGQTKASEPIRMADVYAAGAICSTAPDLLRWSQALERGRVVSRASYRQMTDSADTRGKGVAYGFGLFLGVLSGHPWNAHNGSINGFSTRLARYAADSVSIVVLANTGGVNVTPIERAVARLALGLPDPAPLSLPISPADVARFTGTYEDREHGLVARIGIVDSQFVGYLWQMGRTGLRYQGNGVFALDVDHDFRITFRGDGAIADRMEVTDGVQGTTLVRRP